MLIYFSHCTIMLFWHDLHYIKRDFKVWQMFRIAMIFNDWVDRTASLQCNFLLTAFHSQNSWNPWIWFTELKKQIKFVQQLGYPVKMVSVGIRCPDHWSHTCALSDTDCSRSSSCVCISVSSNMWTIMVRIFYFNYAACSCCSFNCRSN